MSYVNQSSEWLVLNGQSYLSSEGLTNLIKPNYKGAYKQNWKDSRNGYSIIPSQTYGESDKYYGVSWGSNTDGTYAGCFMINKTTGQVSCLQYSENYVTTSQGTGCAYYNGYWYFAVKWSSSSFRLLYFTESSLDTGTPAWTSYTGKNFYWLGKMNNKVIAITSEKSGSNYKVYTATNPTTWIATGGYIPTTAGKCAYHNNYYYINNYRSTDLINWEQIQCELVGVINNKIIGYNSTDKKLYSSLNGSDWTVYINEELKNYACDEEYIYYHTIAEPTTHYRKNDDELIILSENDFWYSSTMNTTEMSFTNLAIKGGYLWTQYTDSSTKYFSIMSQSYCLPNINETLGVKDMVYIKAF